MDEEATEMLLLEDKIDTEISSVKSLPICYTRVTPGKSKRKETAKFKKPGEKVSKASSKMAPCYLQGRQLS